MEGERDRQTMNEIEKEIFRAEGRKRHHDNKKRKVETKRD